MQSKQGEGGERGGAWTLHYFPALGQVLRHRLLPDVADRAGVRHHVPDPGHGALPLLLLAVQVLQVDHLQAALHVRLSRVKSSKHTMQHTIFLKSRSRVW